MIYLTYLEYQRRKRRWFNYDWQPGQRPPADVIQLPVLPRLIPNMNTPSEIAHVDTQQLIDLLREQVGRTPGRFLGVKLQLMFRSVELEVGEAEAQRQLAFIINEYLAEKQAA